ncbi:MAG: peptidase S55 SpoIVB, partial [Acidobacteria bacterium]|nr:peptidase S55 SpoIVB [Acidobacteriota bacterium]
MKRPLFALFALTFLLSLNAFAQKPAASQQAVAFYPLEELRVGQKGVARTVFAGTELQEFGIEVLGVMPGYPQPRQSAIIIRLSGANVERTGVFGGMSGSPVYIDGKLVGAIAFTFNFSKEPIAGVTPIKQMIDIFERGS